MPLIFKTNNIENLRLQANGNLGLETSNPLYKLDVNGTARFSNIITNGKIAIGTGIDSIINNYSLAVNGNAIFNKVKVKLYGNWSDYVFDQSYNLISVKEVEKYIKIIKHLPDIPSANYVKSNGIDIGNNEALLLKKIEELTLYLIQQNKLMEQQQVEIDILKRKFP